MNRTLKNVAATCAGALTTDVLPTHRMTNSRWVDHSPWVSSMRIALLPMLMISCCAYVSDAAADPIASPTAAAPVKDVQGEYFDAKGDPTYKIDPNGSVDWYTFSGFRRYNGTCDVCHGPDGSGSSFGPDLTDSLSSSYADFESVVINGKQDVNTADISGHTVLRHKQECHVLSGRHLRLSSGALGRCPWSRATSCSSTQPAAAASAEDSCMGP